MIKDSYNEVFDGKHRIMFVFAHPDDAELYAGGTISRLVADKKQVCIVKMSSGNKGSKQQVIREEELTKTRETEDTKALETLGIKEDNNIYLHISDGDITNCTEHIGLLSQQIRLFKPDIVITHNPEDVIIRFDTAINWVNHRDHRNTGQCAIDACYPYSRDLLFFPEHFKDQKARSHSVSEFLLVDSYGHRDEVFIDITDYVDNKVAALACHTSQYNTEDAKDSVNFFTKIKGSNKRWERFRYVIAD